MHAKDWALASRERLVAWGKCHQVLPARWIARALDPDNPATGLIVMISVLLLISAAVFFSVLSNVASGSSIVQVDLSIYRLLQSFRSTWADSILDAASSLGSTPTLLALSVLVIAWMVVERRWRTLVYWIAVVAFSQLLAGAIRFTAHEPSLMPDLSQFAPGGHVFPSRAMWRRRSSHLRLAFLLLRRVGVLSGVIVATVSAIVTAVTWRACISATSRHPMRSAAPRSPPSGCF